ncbi:hypothetical protein V6N11_000377 [Hibiscus sabdariffa]|uniref:Reverse transcriptase zinc-binding domain-containing protein n=2 Tax=Hibiscus sabdariffa TaxID=183260 RepID=A0ABR2A8S8_9ROSI
MVDAFGAILKHSVYGGCTTGVQLGPIKPIWKAIAQFQRLPRVKVFLWLLCHAKILTNVDCVRRHKTSGDSCPMCSFLEEDANLMLHFCPAEQLIWGRFVHVDIWVEFMSLSIKE